MICPTHHHIQFSGLFTITKLDEECVWKDISKALHHSKSQRILIGKLLSGFAVYDEPLLVIH